MYFFGDLIVFNLSLAVAFQAVHDTGILEAIVRHPNVWAYTNLLWGFSLLVVKPYRFYRKTNRYMAEFKKAQGIALYGLIIGALRGYGLVQVISLSFVAFHLSFLGIVSMTWRSMFLYGLKVYRKAGYNLRHVVILGHSHSNESIEQFVKQHPELGYRIIGYFDDTITDQPGWLGRQSDLDTYVAKNEIHEVYCNVNYKNEANLNDLVRVCDRYMIRFRVLPESSLFKNRDLRLEFYNDTPVLNFRPLPLDESVNRIAKRAFDIVFSLAVIVGLLSWLLPILGIIIKLDSRGPVIFRQRRTGINNKTFTCFKLRSMTVQENGGAVKQVTKGDARITKVGAFLRASSLDELPQFFNVLLGNMSIVGPRPHPESFSGIYTPQVESYMVRHYGLPGITGLSQVKGYRGETDEDYKMRGRVKLDIFYLEKWSIWLDVRIIWRTVTNAVKGEENAY
jgi:Undecaprenyl-phosphate glucose phosphotransferase